MCFVPNGSAWFKELSEEGDQSVGAVGRTADEKKIRGSTLVGIFEMVDFRCVWFFFQGKN